MAKSTVRWCSRQLTLNVVRRSCRECCHLCLKLKSHLQCWMEWSSWVNFQLFPCCLHSLCYWDILPWRTGVEEVGFETCLMNLHYLQPFTTFLACMVELLSITADIGCLGWNVPFNRHLHIQRTQLLGTNAFKRDLTEEPMAIPSGLHPLSVGTILLSPPLSIYSSTELRVLVCHNLWKCMVGFQKGSDSNI